MEKRFTSGKWILRDGDSSNHFEILGEYGSSKTIAELPNRSFVSKDEAWHNANLIMAAPALLDCCIDMLRILNLNPSYDNQYQRDKLNEVINKAVKAPNEKRYYIQYGIGKVKYVVNVYDGTSTHRDGRPFYGVACFNNKVKMHAYIKTLKTEGYIEKY
jgi:hypothetical protein